MSHIAETHLSTIGWDEYRPLLDSALLAYHDYTRLRDSNPPERLLLALSRLRLRWNLANEARQLAARAHPQAAAYGTARSMSVSADAAEAAAGLHALRAIEAGADALQALADARSALAS